VSARSPIGDTARCVEKAGFASCSRRASGLPIAPATVRAFEIPIPAGRRGREERETRQVHAAIAEPLAECGERQQQREHRDPVGVDDPDRLRCIGAELRRDHGQRGVEDAEVEHRQAESRQDHRHRATALAQG